MQEPILIVVRDGSTKVFSLNTNQEVYIIDQRGSNIENHHFISSNYHKRRCKAISSYCFRN